MTCRVFLGLTERMEDIQEVEEADDPEMINGEEARMTVEEEKEEETLTGGSTRAEGDVNRTGRDEHDDVPWVLIRVSDVGTVRSTGRKITTSSRRREIASNGAEDEIRLEGEAREVRWQLKARIEETIEEKKLRSQLKAWHDQCAVYSQCAVYIAKERKKYGNR